MGQQLYKAHLDTVEQTAQKPTEFNPDTILSNRTQDDISFLLPSKNATDLTSDTCDTSSSRPTATSQLEYIKQIRQHLSLLTQTTVWNVLSDEVLSSLVNLHRSVLADTAANGDSRKQLQVSLGEKFEQDRQSETPIFAQPLANASSNRSEQLSYFALQSLASILLILIKSAEKHDPTLVQQIIALAGQLCVQLPMKSLSSSNHSALLFKSLKPIIDYIHELALTSDPILSKQATIILLTFSVAKGSLKDILPFLSTLLFDTTDVYPAQGLCMQLNNALTETLKTTETILTASEYLTSTGTYPSSELTHLNEQSFTGQFLSSIILAHIDIEHQLDVSHSDPMTFAFHPLTFQQLFSIIERFSADATSSATKTTNFILTVCLRLFKTHLQSLSTVDSKLDKDSNSPIDVSRYATADQIQQWFTLLLQLASDEQADRSSLCRDASQALLCVIHLQTSSFVDKLLLLHQYLVEHTRPILVEQCLIELKKNENLHQWVELLCHDEQKISSVATDVMDSLIDMYFQSAASISEQQKPHLEEILLQFQQLVLCRLLTQCGKKNLINDEPQLSFDQQQTARTSSLVVHYMARIFQNSRQASANDSDLFHSMLLGLALITQTDDVFHYEPIQSILIAVLPLVADYFLRIFNSSSASLSDNQLVCWILSRMSHVLLVGLPVDALESKQSTKLKYSIFSGGCEAVLSDRSEHLKSLLDSNLAKFSQFSKSDESANSHLDRDFLLSIYHQKEEGAQLLAKLKRYHKGKQTPLQKSIEQLANDACAKALAVYVKHYRRLNLAKHELTRSDQSPPHPQLLSIYEYSTRVFALFATIKGQGGDCEQLAQQIDKTALFLLLSVKETTLIPIIEQTMPSIIVKPSGRFLRQCSRWSKAKHVIKLLRHLLQACIRFKRFMLEKRQSIKQVYDHESLVHRTMETFLFGDLSKIGTMINNEEKVIEITELEKCLVRQHERAMTRLLTYRLLKGFVEKVLVVKEQRHYLTICLPLLRRNELDWSYLDHIQTSNERLKQQMSDTYYSIINAVLSEESGERIVVQQLFYLLNFSYELIDFSSLVHYQFLDVFYTKFVRYVHQSESIELKLMAFHWFRLFVFELCQHLELEHLRGTSQPILQQQQERLFQTYILDQLKLFSDIKQQLAADSQEKQTTSMKDMTLGWIVRALQEKQPLITTQTDLDLYINQYLVLLLRCLHVYPHVVHLCTNLDYMQTLLHLYRHSHCIVTLILTVKIFRYLIPSLPEQIHSTSKGLIEEFLRDLLLAIGESRHSAEIALDITPELIYLYRTLMSVESAWQAMATQLIFDAIQSYLNTKSIETNNAREINQLFASLCVLGGYIEPYRIGSTVKLIAEDEVLDESQFALIVDSGTEMSVQYFRKNQVESVTVDKLQLETDVAPPNLLAVLNSSNESETMIHTLLDTLGHFIQIETTTNASYLLLQLQRRAMAVLYHLLSTRPSIELFMKKPYASILAQLSIADALEPSHRQPTDLRVFDKSHLEQYCLSLDLCERKKQIVEATNEVTTNPVTLESIDERGMTNERDPSVIEALSPSKYHGWKPTMFEAEVPYLEKGRLGSRSITLAPMPRSISTAKVFHECGDKHKFLGRIVPEYGNTDVGFPTYIIDNLQFSEGKWYFCVRLPVGGVVQIGWATDGFTPGGSSGVGDDGYSWSYDGSRAVLFNDGSHYGVFDDVNWTENDVCGCGIEINGDKTNIKYWLNGKLLGTAFAHKRSIESSHSKCNLLPNGPGTTFYPAVTIQRTSDPPRSCEIIVSPEDMNECPLPTGYRPLLLPKTVRSEHCIVDYPFNAYVVGDYSDDYVYTNRTKPTETLLRDFVNEQHLATAFTTENHRLVLPEKSPGFPLQLDMGHASSFTISFDFQLFPDDKNLDFQLCTIDLPETISIPGTSKSSEQQGYVAIIVDLKERRVQVYSKEHGQISDTRYVNRSFTQLKMQILPGIAAGLKNIAVWKYSLSEDDLRRLFTYDLSFISIEYRAIKNFRQQVKTISFAANQQTFLDGSLVPLDQPFQEEIWELKKKQADESERDYFRLINNSDASAVELRNAKTYLVVEKSADPWSSYVLIMDISIPQWPRTKEKLTLVNLNDKCTLSITDEGKLELVTNDKEHLSKSTVVLNEYIRLCVAVLEKTVVVYVNKVPEITAETPVDQLQIKSNHIELFKQTDNTTNDSTSNDTVRLSLKSFTYINQQLARAFHDKYIDSPNTSLNSSVAIPLSLIGPTLVAMGYKKSWIESTVKANPDRHFPTIHAVLREQKEQFIQKDLEDEERRYLQVLSRLDPSTDQDHFRSLLHSSTWTTNKQIGNVAQSLFTHWIHSPVSKTPAQGTVVLSETDWFTQTVSDLGITTKFAEWTRDKSNATADEDSIYQLLDLSNPQQNAGISTPSTKDARKSAQYSHTELSRKQFLQSRLACEHGLIIAYARSTILNMLNVWSSNGTVRFPFESFADYSLLIRLIKLLKTTSTETGESASQLHALLQVIVNEEMGQLLEPITHSSDVNDEALRSKAPFFYHLQKEIITHAVEYLFQSTFAQMSRNTESSPLQFTFEILDLYMKQLRSNQSSMTQHQIDAMLSLFFPRPLIYLLFDLFLLTPTYRERLFILHLFTK